MQPSAVRKLNVQSFVWGGKQIMVMSYKAGNYLNIIITSNAELVSNSAPVYSKSLKSHFIVTRRAYRLFWEHQTRFPKTAETTHEHHI